MEYVKPADTTPRVGNSAYFKPGDEAQDIEYFKERLGYEALNQDMLTQEAKGLAAIDEVSNDDDDEELHCFEFDELGCPEDEGIYSKKASSALSPKRSITSFTYDGESMLDEDFIDIGNITEGTEQTKATKKYFKQRWWLINPERWPKRYWDNFIAFIIVGSSYKDLCGDGSTDQVQFLRRWRIPSMGCDRLGCRLCVLPRYDSDVL